jgi:hypothetical protein
MTFSILNGDGSPLSESDALLIKILENGALNVD